MMDVRDTCCEEGRLLKLAQNCVQWQALCTSNAEASGYATII